MKAKLIFHPKAILHMDTMSTSMGVSPYISAISYI